MARFWTCRKCKDKWPRTKRVCVNCGQKRPAPRKAKHLKALDVPYAEWVQEFGSFCGICRRSASAKRRLDRDHDHKTGKPRGLLCARCNRALPSWVTVEWLEAAQEYLQQEDGDARDSDET